MKNKLVMRRYKSYWLKMTLVLKLIVVCLLFSSFSIQENMYSNEEKEFLNFENTKSSDVSEIKETPMHSLKTSIEINEDSEVLLMQKITISGMVTDIQGQPLPGANILEKGTNNGTQTDFDGLFSIDVSNANSVLVFSYLGFVTQEVSLVGKTELKVILKEDTSQLDEVVVIGYGTSKKSDLTGSVGSLKANNIAQSQSNDVLNAMQGRIAGVNISSESGEPGAGINIQIRGAGSFFGSSSPLFVIDGIQIDVNPNEVATSGTASQSTMNPLSNINPNDIESIEVLKDASATAIYGSRGANGVVIITTKSGKSGKPVFEINSFMGVSQTTKKLDVLSPEDYVEYQRLRGNTGFYSIDTDGDGVLDTDRNFDNIPSHDWQDETFRTAFTQNYDFLVSGGNGKSNYSASVGALSQEGIVRNNNYDRYNFRLKVNHQQSDKLSFGFNINTSFAEQTGVTSNGGNGGGSFNGVIQLIALANPWEIVDPDTETATDQYISPIALVEDSSKSTKFNRIIGNVSAKYKFTEALALEGNFGLNSSNSKLKEFYPTTTTWGNYWGGKAGLSVRDVSSYNTALLLRYNKKIGKKHNIKAFTAFEAAHYSFESFENEITGFEDESTGINDISKGATVNSYTTNAFITNRLSYLGRINYSFANKYLFTVSFRADGSDKFGAKNRWGYFPSGAFAWRVDKERFMKNIKPISNLKFRLSYGETGNERIPAYSQYATLENTFYASNNEILFGLSPDSRENPDLKWETTVQYNAGIDLGLFNNRLNMSYNIYKKDTKDMLVDTPIASQSGFYSQFTNLGDVENVGMELELSAIIVDKQDFTWRSDFNISYYRNKVNSIGGADFFPVTIGGGWLTTPGRVIVGEPIGVMYGFKQEGVYQIDDFTWQNDSDPNVAFADRIYTLKDGVVNYTGAQPGSLKYQDTTGDGIVDDEDRTVIGDSNPDYIGGWNNSFTYKNFDLSFFFQWNVGNDIFNAGKLRLNGFQSFLNVSEDFYNNAWTEDNPSNEEPALGQVNSVISDYFVEDGSFLRFKTLSFGYSLPQKFLEGQNISSLRLYLTATNLFTWTNYSGYDPEVQSNNALLRGYERISYPRSKSITMGVNIKF